MTTRQAATISKVTYGKEDHGILTCWVHLDFDGSGQGFGGLCLDEKTGEAYKEELLKLFRVKELKQLEGKECFALRCFEGWGEDIEGLENVRGERFTITGFRKKMWPDGESSKSQLENRKERILRDIYYNTKRNQEMKYDLERLDSKFVDWEK